MLQDIVKERIQKTVNSLQIEDEVHLEHPANSSFGDFTTNIALQAAKTLKKNPVEVAEEIAKALPLDAVIEKVEVVKPGFINIWLSKKLLISELETIYTQKDSYGSNTWGNDMKWLIEHTSPNPNKAMHLGHLRNNVTGMALANLWEFIGIEVVRDCIDNNRGIAIAKLMWGYLKFARKDGKDITNNHTIYPDPYDYWAGHKDEWATPDDLKMRPDTFVDDLYVKGSEDFKDKDVETKVRIMVVEWEQGVQKIRELWKQVLDYSYEGQNRTLKRLGNRWDKVWHEHEHYQMGKDIVEEGLKKGIFKKTESGAVVSDLEKYKLPDTIIIKTDGTSLYITQDLALTKLKRDTFHPDKLHWVIGPEQSLALRQLFAICEQLGIGKLTDYIHIDYGYMSLKGKGKMSSREGNVVYIDDLIDQAKEVIKEKMDKSKFSENEIDETAEKIAVGAIKYSILKSGRTTNTAFDFETSLTFDGDSGPYLEYVYVRAKRLLETEFDHKVQNDYDLNEEELHVLRLLSKFPTVVLNSALQYAPNFIATYLFDLAQTFNFFYQKHQILKSSEDTKNFRLMLTEATAQVIKNGLKLLGVETVERM
ncbi:MAG: arginine--tRNA ligase [Patescibacteria group bacterium]